MTLLKERFVYTKIDRATTEGRRLYSLPDGSKVPSVTTILDKTKPKEKLEALLAWKRRVGEAKPWNTYAQVPRGLYCTGYS